MKNFSSVVAVSSLVLAVGAALAPVTADAATSTRQFGTNPTGICQGALPAFETQIRKRPLAVQNEGTSASFVTCSFTSQGSWGGGIANPTAITVYLESFNGSAIDVSCTGVAGYSGSAQYVVKNATLPATGAQASMTWNNEDFEGAPANFPSGLFSISCSLPPGAAINDSYVYFAEEIGT